MLQDINDTDQDAEALSRFIKEIGFPALLHVNLIRYNTTGHLWLPSSKEQTLKFKRLLENKGVAVTIRKSLGQDIQGACGQLAGEKI